MHHNPQNPKWPDRDRFVLSKGHGAPALYATLARSGYFDLSELNNLRKLGSILQGHPDMKVTPGVEISTGSLGQGLSMANGMALALKLDKRAARVYVLMGDGENQEGQIWEAAMAAAHYRLDNLCGIIDYNGLQIDGPVNEIMKIEPIRDKWLAFGWEVFEIDGHNFAEIISALDQAETVKNKPCLILAHTIKGKGVSFFEGKVKYHGVAPTDEELEKALFELGVV
jgi:transketolase